MKLVYLFCFTLSAFPSLAQLSDVKGVVSILNSQTETGTRKYVSGAQVTDNFDEAARVITNLEGQFRLIYSGKPIGASVHFTIYKPSSDLEVVNIADLSAITGQNKWVSISMAPKGKIAELRKRIYQVGRTAAEKRLDELVRKTQYNIADLKKDSTRNAARIKQLEGDIASLEESRKKVQAYAQDLAERYAPINLDDASPLFRDAFRLFQNGKLDSALLILNSLDLSNIVYLVMKERKKISQLKEEVSNRDSLEKQRSKDVAEALRLKADLHKVRYEFDSVSTCFELQMQLDTTNNEYTLQYAAFLAWLNRDEQALFYYNKVLEKLNQQAPADSLQAKTYFAEINNNMGLIHKGQSEFSKAEAEFGQALAIYQRLARIDPVTNDPNIAFTQKNLGGLYVSMKQFAKAEIALNSALAIDQRLAKKDPVTYEPDVAAALHDLGVLYLDKKDFPKADSALRAALVIYRAQAEKDPAFYEEYVALTQNSLGILYQDWNDFARSEKAYREALAIRIKMAQKNPARYEPDVATGQHNLGLLYWNMNDFPHAEAALRVALEITQRLSATNPATEEPFVGSAQNSLGNLYMDEGDYQKSELAFLESLHIREKLAKANPIAYLPDVASTQYNLAILYAARGDSSRADTAYRDALAIFKRLADKEPAIYASTVATIQIARSGLYSNQEALPDAEAYASEALRIYQSLAKTNPAAYEPGIAKAQYTLGNIYLKEINIPQAEITLRAAVDLYQKLAITYPSAYRPSMADAEIDLGNCYAYKKDFPRAIATYHKALDIYEPLAKANPSVYDKNVAQVQWRLGNLYLHRKNYPLSEASFLASIAASEKWVKTNPAVYGTYWRDSKNNLAFLYAAYVDSTTTRQRKLAYQLKEVAVIGDLNSFSNGNAETAGQLAYALGNLAWYQLFTPQPQKAEEAARKALNLDPSQIWIKVNLAHALLLQGKYDAALALYAELKPLKNETNEPYPADCLHDLDEFEKAGLTNKDFARIRHFLLH